MRRLLVLSLLGSTAAMAQVSGPLVTEPAFMATSESMETLAQRAEVNAFAVREFRISRNHTRNKAEVLASAGAALSAATSMVGTSVNVIPPAAYTQTATYQPLGAPIGANFGALGIGTPGYTISGAPPDTTLAVSPTQIVQWVNTEFAVYTKTGVPLLPTPGFLPGNAIWSALPAASLCRNFNQGDPIVQYDRIAQRWIFSQFAFNNTFSANAQCIAG